MMRSNLERGKLLSLGLALALAMLTACASPGPDDRPRYHTVRRGETVWRIAQDYGTTVAEITRANKIRDVTTVRTGTRLLIPPSTGYRPKRSATRYTSALPQGRAGDATLAWPLSGKLTSPYGLRGAAHHDGIDIQAPTGATIRAAASGRVIHSDASVAGYGNMVIVKHAGSVSTVYAHNRRNIVRVGEFVQQGQPIAELGQTGRTTAPHLHFEVRRDGRPRDPLKYLP